MRNAFRNMIKNIRERLVIKQTIGAVLTLIIVIGCVVSFFHWGENKQIAADGTAGQPVTSDSMLKEADSNRSSGNNQMKDLTTEIRGEEDTDIEEETVTDDRKEENRVQTVGNDSENNKKDSIEKNSEISKDSKSEEIKRATEQQDNRTVAQNVPETIRQSEPVNMEKILPEILDDNIDYQQAQTVQEIKSQINDSPMPQTQSQESKKTNPETIPQKAIQPEVSQPSTEPSKPSYVGYRTDLDMQAKELILHERSISNLPDTNPNPVWNEHLYKVAQARAKEIVDNFSHNSPYAMSGYSTLEAITKYSVFYFSDSADIAVNNWINSPEHHHIIVAGDQFAVACYQNGDDLYWVCLTANEKYYIAENWADDYAKDWGSKYQEKYDKAYDMFVTQYGERNIW